MLIIHIHWIELGIFMRFIYIDLAPKVVNF